MTREHTKNRSNRRTKLGKTWHWRAKNFHTLINIDSREKSCRIRFLSEHYDCSSLSFTIIKEYRVVFCHGFRLVKICNQVFFYLSRESVLNLSLVGYTYTFKYTHTFKKCLKRCVYDHSVTRLIRYRLLSVWHSRALIPSLLFFYRKSNVWLHTSFLRRGLHPSFHMYVKISTSADVALSSTYMLTLYAWIDVNLAWNFQPWRIRFNLLRFILHIFIAYLKCTLFWF